MFQMAMFAETLDRHETVDAVLKLEAEGAMAAQARAVVVKVTRVISESPARWSHPARHGLAQAGYLSLGPAQNRS